MAQKYDNSLSTIEDNETQITIQSQSNIELLTTNAKQIVPFSIGDKGKALGSQICSLVPAGVNAAQQYGMAVVKFPPGVGWNDLCKRGSDGWNLLSSFGADGKFNDMAAIKQAGLQLSGIANLALAGAAIVVGQAYMTQINNKLASIEDGISEILAEMEAERNAKLYSTFDMLRRYAEHFDEYNFDPQKRQTALIGIDRALKEAGELWYYQIAAIEKLNNDISSKQSTKPEEIKEKTNKLDQLEYKCGQVFQLYALACQIGMQYDNDFSEKRINKEKDELISQLNKYFHARGEACVSLMDKIDNVKGFPIALAPEQKVDTNEVHKAAAIGGIFGLSGSVIAGAVRANYHRINPVNMINAAKENNEKQKRELREVLENGDEVKPVEENQMGLLEQMNFMYNKADSMVFDDDKILFIES